MIRRFDKSPAAAKNAATQFHIAARAGDTDALQRDLSTSKVDINVRDTFTQTPLHWAAYAGRVNAVRFLLANGANPNATDKNGFTPLHSAASAGERSLDHLNVCKLLLRNGAKPNMLTNNTTSVMHYLARFPFSELLLRVMKMVVLKGVDVDCTEKEGGDTPLHQAALRGAPETVRFLTQWGADVNQANRVGETPLHLAVRGGKVENVSILLKHKECSLSVVGPDGIPTDVAAKCANSDIIQLFEGV